MHFLWKNWCGFLAIFWFALAVVAFFYGDRLEALLCLVLMNQYFDKQRQED